jgi:hypothetical protein
MISDTTNELRRWMQLVEAQAKKPERPGAAPMYFLRDTADPDGDLQRNFSCYAGTWTADHQEAVELAKTSSLLRKPLQDPKSKLWCYSPERGLSSFAFHDLASLRHAYQQVMSEFYVGGGDKVAVFTSREYELRAGADGEDVFRNGRFIGYAPATVEGICGLIGWNSAKDS